MQTVEATWFYDITGPDRALERITVPFTMRLVGRYEIALLLDAAGFVVELFRKHGVHYKPSERSKSDCFRELLPLLNARRVASRSSESSFAAAAAAPIAPHVAVL